MVGEMPRGSRGRRLETDLYQELDGVTHRMDYRGAQGLDVTQVFRVINERTREPLENLGQQSVAEPGVIDGIVDTYIAAATQ